MTLGQREAVLEGVVKIRYDHYRLDNKYGAPVHNSYFYRANDGEAIERSPRGGFTQVTLYFSDGRIIEGSSRCSAKDNFNKAIGRQIALGRAIKASLA